MLRRIPLLVALVCATTPHPSSAQTPANGTSVPMEFVVTVMHGGDGRDLHVGGIPQALAVVVPIEGVGRIVGSQGDEHRGTMALAVDGSVPDALAAFRARMEAGGWTHPNIRPRRSNGGFQPSAGEPNADRFFCSPGHMAQISGVDFSGQAYLRIYVSDADHTFCDPAQQRMSMSGPARLPELRGPEGAEVTGGGVGGSSGYSESETMVLTALPVSDLAASFAAQLEDAGWEPAGGGGDDDIAFRRFRFTDEDGEAWIGTLTLWRLADDTVRAHVRRDRMSARF